MDPYLDPTTTAQEDLLGVIQNRIQYRNSKEFKDFAESEIESRKSEYLENALKAARLMKPEYAFESMQWLLRYDSLMDITSGSLAFMEAGLSQLTDKPV